MVRKWQLLLAAAAAALSLSACGGSDSEGGGSSNAGERPAGGISAHDEKVLEGIHADVRGWNKAAGPWVKAFGGDDADRFLAVHQRSLKPLNSAAAGIEGGSYQITDRSLRELVVPIGNGYRTQYEAIVDIGDGMSSGDQQAVENATRKVRRANRRKGRAVNRLADRFPELGRSF
jgi:hypothetical protein